MPLTYAQVAKLETDPLRKGIIANVIRHSDILSWLPMEPVSALRVAALRWTKYPTSGNRKIGGAYTEDTSGDVEDVWDAVYAYGGDIEYDNVFEKIRASLIMDPVVAHTQKKLESIAIRFNDDFITGDHADNPDGFEGLRKRVAGMPARQTVCATATVVAAPLDVTASIANARRFLNMLDRAIKRANGGKNIGGLLMNEDMLDGFNRLGKLLGSGMLLDMTQDGYDREFVTYKGHPLMDVGTLEDQTTEIISNTLTAGDGGADSTEIYIPAFGIEEGIVGGELTPLSAYDVGGEMESKPSKLKRVDWWVGLFGFSSYGVTRLWNIADPNGWTE